MFRIIQWGRVVCWWSSTTKENFKTCGRHYVQDEGIDAL